MGSEGPGPPSPYGPPPGQGYGPPPGQGYGPPQGWYGPPPGYGYPVPAPIPASMIVLVVLSGIATTSCYFTLAGLPSVILGAIAMTTHRRDPQRAQHLAKIGWIVFGSVSAFIVLAVVVGIAVSAGSS